MNENITNINICSLYFLFGILIFFICFLMIITVLSESKKKKLPPGYSIITNGKVFKWKDDSGFVSKFNEHNNIKSAIRAANYFYELELKCKKEEKWKEIKKKNGRR